MAFLKKKPKGGIHFKANIEVSIPGTTDQVALFVVKWMFFMLVWGIANYFHECVDVLILVVVSFLLINISFIT